MLKESGPGVACVLAGHGDEVVFAWPPFEAYPAMKENAGATPVYVRLASHRHNIDAMAAIVTERAAF
ncbi:hypothetical protein LX90_008088 [Lentzea flava]|nr:hypothetical protein [Lentzea flava]MCP2204358.1 hypothetical protein [Lentzea flava]